jgi:prevent-host-death family protein
MSERTVSVAEAKAHLSELIAAAEAGEDVVITRRGKPIVGLVRLESVKKKVDLDWLREMTKDIPYQEQDSGSFMRGVRDTDRY